jgi:hypothetical protein
MSDTMHPMAICMSINLDRQYALPWQTILAKPKYGKYWAEI